MTVIAWIAVALIVALLATKMTAKPRQERARAAGLEDLSFPRAAEGDPYPLIFGRVKLKSMNVINYFDFVAQAFKKKGQFAGYNYLLGATFGLCCGVPSGIRLRRIWIGNKVLWEGLSDGNPDGFEITVHDTEFLGGVNSRGGVSGTMTFYPGTFNDAKDPYEDSKTVGGSTRYPGLCRITLGTAAHPLFWIGNSENIDPWWFELEHIPNNLGLDSGPSWNGVDANAMEVLWFLITDPWSSLGKSASILDADSFRACGNVLNAEHNGMSLIIDQANTGSDIATEIVRQTDCVIYEEPTTAKIVVALQRPDDVPVCTLTVDDVTTVSNYGHTLWPSTYNVIRIKYRDRDKNYADAVATDSDFANVGWQGGIRSVDYSMPMVYDNTLASALASRILGQSNVPLMQAQLTCTREQASRLRPGKIFLWTFPEYNLVNVRMRVGKYNDGSIEDGKIILVASQDSYTKVSGFGVQPPSTSTSPSARDPQPILQAAVSEAPYYIARNMGATDDPAWGPNALVFLGLCAKPSGAYSVGFELATADAILSEGIQPYTPHGTLTTAYNATIGGDTAYDTTTGLVLTGLSDAGLLGTFAAGDQRLGKGLVKVDDEYMAFSAYTVASGVYTLTGIRRALFGTAKATHAVGAVVYFVDVFSGASEIPTQVSASSGTMDVYPLDYTDQRGMPQSGQTPAHVAYAHNTFAPLPPDYLRVSQPDGSNKKKLQFNWANRENYAPAMALYDDASQPWSSATAITGSILFNSATTPVAITGATQADTVTVDYTSNSDVVAGANTAVVVMTATRDGYSRSRTTNIAFTV